MNTHFNSNGLIGLISGLAVCAGFADTIDTPKRGFGLGDVQQIAVSADQRYMASAGQAGAFLWDFQTGELLQRLPTDSSVTALAFSPDGESVLGADRAVIRAWHTATGEPWRELTGHTLEVGHLEFTPTGEWLVSASADGTARIWSWPDGREHRRVDSRGASMMAAILSPNERLLVTADSSPPESVTIWDVATATPLRSLPLENAAVDHLIFTKSGHLATSAGDRSVSLWDVETGRLVRSFAGVTAPTIFIRCLWTPNEATLAAVGDDGRIFTWAIDTGESLAVMAGEPNITAAGVPDAMQVVTADPDFQLRRREIPSGDLRQTFRGHTTSTHSAVAVSPDGRYVLSGGTEATTRLWDRRAGTPVRSFIGQGAGTMAAAFSADGSQVLTTVGLPSPAARLWKTDTGELLREFKWAASWPMSAALSRDGTRVAAGAQDGRVRIFSATSGVLLQSLAAPGWARSVAFAPNAPFVAVGSSDANARIFNHTTGQLLHTLFADATAVVTVAFSPDGRTLLVAWSDGLVRLFDALTFEQLGEFGRPAFLESAAYAPDGNYIVTGEGWPLFTATIWDARTQEEMRTLAGHKWPVGAVAFSPTGASVVTAGEVVLEWSTADLAARLRGEPQGDHLDLTWSFGSLEQAPSPNGPWETVSTASSPFRAAVDGPAGYFRVRAEPEE